MASVKNSLADLLTRPVSTSVRDAFGRPVSRYVANPFAYVPLVGLSADYFANYTREQSIATPLFTSFDDARMSSTNALNFADEDLRAKMLGDAIPAESFAAGAIAPEGTGMQSASRTMIPIGATRSASVRGETKMATSWRRTTERSTATSSSKAMTGEVLSA